jgi:hypothetical protein
MVPLSAFGVTRIGEDGKIYLISKSKHYHAPPGHGFPGYKLDKTYSEPECAGRIPVFI